MPSLGHSSLQEAPVAPRGITRRSVATGLAWASPVIAIAAAAPAMATSGPQPVVVPGSACKLPGSSCDPLVKGYLFQFTVSNPSPVPVWLYTGGTYGPTITDDSPILDLTYEKARVGGILYNPGQHIPIPANTTAIVYLNAGVSANSQNVQDITIVVTLQWGHNSNPALDTDHVGEPVVATLYSPDTPPCKNCTVN